MKREINIFLILMMALLGTSCEVEFDLKMEGENIIFVECLPGVTDYISVSVRPCVAVNSSYDVKNFRPDVKVFVNGDMVPVTKQEGADVPRGGAAGSYVADVAPLPDDEIKVVVSADGFETVESVTRVPVPVSYDGLEYEVFDMTDEQQTKDVGQSPGVNYNLRLRVKWPIKDDPYATDAYGIQLVREQQYEYYAKDSNGEFFDKDTTLACYSGIITAMGDNPLLPQTSSVLNVNYNGYSFECYESLTMFMDKDFNGEDHILEGIWTYNEGMHAEDKGENGDYIYITDIKYRYKIRLYKMTSDFSRYAYAQNQIDENIFGEVGLAPAGYAFTNIINGAGVLAGVLMYETDWLEL